MPTLAHVFPLIIHYVVNSIPNTRSIIFSSQASPCIPSSLSRPCLGLIFTADYPGGSKAVKISEEEEEEEERL